MEEAVFVGLGTVINVAAILIGSTLGIFAGAKFKEQTRDLVTTVLGFVTLLAAADALKQLWNKNFSDLVSRFGIKPHKTTELYYRNRVDSKDATIRRNEFGVDFNFEPAHVLEKVFLNLNYIDYNFLVPLANQATQSTGITSRFHINKEWYFGGELRRGANLTNSFPVSARFNLGYLGECAQLKISAFKDYTRDPTRNIRPSKGFVIDLDVHLKNISD